MNKQEKKLMESISIIKEFLYNNPREYLAQPYRKQVDKVVKDIRISIEKYLKQHPVKKFK